MLTSESEFALLRSKWELLEVRFTQRENPTRILTFVVKLFLQHLA